MTKALELRKEEKEQMIKSYSVWGERYKFLFMYKCLWQKQSVCGAVFLKNYFSPFVNNPEVMRLYNHSNIEY